MRALVIGASGQVGAALVSRLRARGHDVVGTHRDTPVGDTRRLDILDLDATGRLIAEAGAAWVFFPAGVTHVDWCEDHRAEAMAANRDAPAAAAREARRHGAGFVYFSTEYVFDGKRGPYGESDPTNPLSVYGVSKLEGERAVLAATSRALVVRTTVVYGPEPRGKNFVCQLLRRAETGERMRVPVDQRSSPTYNQDLAAAVVALAERGHAGVVHVAGPEVLDRHAFALLVCETFGLDPGFIEPVATADLGQRAPRPLDAGLRIDLVRRLVPARLRGPREGLAAMRDALRSVDTPGTGR